MIEMSVKKLVQYGKETGLIEKEDEIYARNRSWKFSAWRI